MVRRMIRMIKPQMTTNEINKFINYLECCIIDLIDIKGCVDCIKLLKADLTIYKKRNELKEVKYSGSKSKTQ